MSKYIIPEKFKEGFEDLITFKEELFDKLVRFFSEVKIGTGPVEFSKELKEHFPNQANLNLSQVLYSFGSLLNNKAEISNIELAKELTEAFNELSSEKINNDLLNARLCSLFQASNNLKITVKALELLKENDNVYTDSRILSDVRMIFNEDLTEDNNCALIMHNLRLNYLSNNEEKEFYISLDLNDLKKLQKTINRAIEKDETIKNINNNLQFIYINE